jgi:hypothetical protein
MKPPARQNEQRMRTRVAMQRPHHAAEGRMPDRERRIKAGWLRLWKAVYPNTPPPTESSLESKVLSPESAAHSPQTEVHGPRSRPETQDSRPETQASAADYLSRFLCAGFALALLVSGCAGPRPLKGGKASTTRNPAGVIQQTVAQGENASQPTKQDQETIKVRTYTLPAATRIEQCAPPVAAAAPVRSADKNVRAPSRSQPSALNSQPCSEASTLNAQPSTTYVLTCIFHKTSKFSRPTRVWG